MEPRLFRRGDSPPYGPIEIGKGLLQWSHAFSGVETRKTSTNQSKRLSPSMEPRLFRRGDVPPTPIPVTYDTSLQWSHAFSGVETLMSLNMPCG